MVDESVKIGPFSVEDRIGIGGMGEVFRARHERYDTEAAVKILTADRVRRRRFLRAFREEVRALAKLDHPSIAAVYDHGVVEERDHSLAGEGTPWLAMEFVEGPDLSETKAVEHWTVLESVLLSLLDALAHAHAHDVVHRDLKPGNILVVSRARDELEVRLLDFGVARVFDEEFAEEEVDDEENSVRGTPKYMAPEQILGRWRDQGPWTDLYAFGCLAWRLVTGRAPFTEQTTEEVLERHIRKRPRRFEPIMDVPDRFRGWLERLLAKRPSDRFRRAADAAYGLARITEGWSPEEPESMLDGDRDGDPFDVEKYPTLAALEPTIVDTNSAPQSSSSAASAFSSATLTEISDADLPSVSDAAIETVPPPVSSDWRRPGRDGDRMRRGASLGLFGLRKIPMVDRDRERGALWRMLQQVRRTDRPHAVLLSGGAAAGKSRLAEWLVRRAHELGAATTLRATHSSEAEWSDGLGPMLARYFRTFQLDWEEALDRVQEQLSELDIGEMARVHDAVGLTHLMGHRPDERPEHFPGGFETERERNAAIRRVVEGLGRERGVVLWLDDAVWGQDSIEFARSLFGPGADGELPVLVVMTCRDSDRREADAGSELLEEMLERGHLEELAIEPLSGEDHRELVEQMVALDGDLAAEVATHTEGRPLFATQLLRDWVDRDLLVPGDEGYRLGVDERESPSRSLFPSDLDDLWEQRLEAAFASTEGISVECGFHSVELAAALGRHVERDEWEAVCESAGVEGCDAIEHALLERGLAESGDDGWHFIHAKLTSALRDRARDADRWTSHHRRCAEALEEVLPRRRDALLRQADHLLEAGDREAALEPLYAAAVNCGATGRYEEDNRLLERRRELMDELGLAEGDRRRVQNQIGLASNLLHLGESERAEALLREAETYCRDREWDGELAETLQGLGRIHSERGETDEATRLTKEAVERYREAGDAEGEWQARAVFGWIYQQAGETERAREILTEAVQQLEELGGTTGFVRATNWLATTYLTSHEYEKAQQLLEAIHEAIRNSGLRSAEGQEWNLRGEIARFQGDWDRAKRSYERARELAVQSGERSLAIIDLNLAMVELADGGYHRAEREFERVAEGLRESGMQGRLPRVRVGLAACAAGRRDWEVFDRRLETVESKAVGEGLMSYDDPWLGEFMAEFAEEADEPERARRAWTVVANLWKQAGHPDRASDAIARAAELRSSADRG